MSVGRTTDARCFSAHGFSAAVAQLLRADLGPVGPAARALLDQRLLGCCLQPPLPRNCSSPCDGQRSASRRRGAVPPCLRRQALATPENRLPRRPSSACSSPTSTSASDPSSDPPLPICGLNHLFFSRAACSAFWRRRSSARPSAALTSSPTVRALAGGAPGAPDSRKRRSSSARRCASYPLARLRPCADRNDLFVVGHVDPLDGDLDAEHSRCGPAVGAVRCGSPAVLRGIARGNGCIDGFE